MNHPDEPRIAELAMKTAARQITPAEQAELDALLAREPAAKAEFAQHLAEAQALAGAASLLNATESRSDELPGYARERLRTKVRETYGAQVSAPSKPASAWNTWRIFLALAAGAAVLAVAALLLVRPQGPVVQVAMLDTVGAIRGGPNNELTLLREAWPEKTVSEFRTATESESWRQGATGASKDEALVLYDRAAGEIQVAGRRSGQSFSRSFPVEPDLKTALVEARRYLEQQFRR